MIPMLSALACMFGFGLINWLLGEHWPFWAFIGVFTLCLLVAEFEQFKKELVKKLDALIVKSESLDYLDSLDDHLDNMEGSLKILREKK